MKYVVYWSKTGTPEGSSYGAWPSPELDSWGMAEQAFCLRFPSLQMREVLTMECWAEAGSPQGTERVKEHLGCLTKMTGAGAEKFLEEDKKFFAEAGKHLKKPWSDKEIDALLGLPIKRVEPPLEADNIIRVWPIPNAWGRTK